MPYLKPTNRNQITDPVGDWPVINLERIGTPGDINYAIQALAVAYIQNTGRTVNYTTLNDVIGALEAAKLEFYRRIVVPYENTKIRENGDLEEFQALGKAMLGVGG